MCPSVERKPTPEKPDTTWNKEGSSGEPNPPHESLKIDSFQSRADEQSCVALTMDPSDSVCRSGPHVLGVRAAYMDGHPRDLGPRAVHLRNQAEAGCVPVGVARNEGAARAQLPDAFRQSGYRRGELCPFLLQVGVRGAEPG